MPFIAIGLVALAFVVVAVKYIGPMLYYISERLAGRSLGDVPVLWDFWWPVYLIVAANVMERTRRCWLAFIALGVVRVFWAVIVLTLFFAKPAWDYWHLQWALYEIVTAGVMTAGVLYAMMPSTRHDLLSRSSQLPVSV